MQVRPLGDAALVVVLGSTIDDATHERVRAAYDALVAARIEGVHDIVPAYSGVAIHYDPLAFRGGDLLPFDAASQTVLDVIRSAPRTTHGDRRTIEIRVRYGGVDGPDIEDVARHTGLTVEDVVRLHSGAEYTVHMIGFTPGFPFLGGLPPALVTPRRAVPRAAVPAGSVGIGGAQTGIYPLETPGGWNLIGRTDEKLFRPDDDPPTLLRIGDRVRFVPVTRG